LQLPRPRPPRSRRVSWGVLAVAVLLVVPLAAVAVGWRLSQPSASPAPAATVPPAPAGKERTDASPPSTSSPSLSTARLAPGVLWQQTGSDSATSRPFSAPRSWRIVWSFDCRNFAAYGGGNFKLTGDGAFGRVLVQRFAVKGHGTARVMGGGRGRLAVESVCRRWTVKAITP
jgi:hypothetical protein